MDFQFLIQSFIALLPLSFFTAFWYMLGIRTGEGKREDRITSPLGHRSFGARCHVYSSVCALGT